MIEKDDDVYLTHIMECIKAIERFLAGGSMVFFGNEMAREASIRKLQVMAESTIKLLDKAKFAMPEIDWRGLAAFRHILVHDYLGDLNIDIMWQHIETRLPEMKDSIRQYSQKETL